MRESIGQILLGCGSSAPWIIFGLTLLAGINIPISIDILLVFTAFLAAVVMPEKALLLFTCFTLGSILSAWISYWLGRKLGRKLLQINLFAKLIPEARLHSMSRFYQKYGAYTFLVGRFIPFGVRNCLFFSTGMSRFSFRKFIFWDGLACSCWSALFFTLFYRLSQHYEILLAHLKIINIVIFVAFSLAVIGIICYKVNKRT